MTKDLQNSFCIEVIQGKPIDDSQADTITQLLFSWWKRGLEPANDLSHPSCRNRSLSLEQNELTNKVGYRKLKVFKLR